MAVFDESYYLSRNADVAQAVRSGGFSSGQQHYQVLGMAEGRWGSDTLEFQQSYYLANNPDVAAAARAGSITAYDHYVNFGKAEGRQGSPVGVFSPAYYMAENPDVRLSGTVADVHYLAFGAQEGRAGSAGFNESGYLARYRDIAAAVFSGAIPSGREHYMSLGRMEGRNPSGTAFDEGAYLNSNPDVAAVVRTGALASGFAHYQQFGAAEGRHAEWLGRQIDASVATRSFALTGAAGPDIITGGSGNDTLYGLNGADQLNGGTGNDFIDGGAGADTLYGGEGADTIMGGAGNDWLYGDAGNDTLIGGGGLDQLIGGDGADIFRFTAPSDAGFGETIQDFVSGQDKIDLSQMLGGGEIVFVGDNPFSTAKVKQVRTSYMATSGQMGVPPKTNAYVYVDANGDGFSDATITVLGVSSLKSTDFILS